MRVKDRSFLPGGIGHAANRQPSIFSARSAWAPKTTESGHREERIALVWGTGGDQVCYP